jgi:hypothetical protein
MIMVVYVKDQKGHLKSLKELSLQYQVPLQLIQGRYQNGYRKIDDLIQEKWGMCDWKKGEMGNAKSDQN